RACEIACPSGVQYGELLESTREHIEHHYRRSTFQTFLRRVAIEKVFPFPARMKVALLPARMIRFLRAESLLPKFVREALSLIPADAREGAWPEYSPGAPVSDPAPSAQHAGSETGAPAKRRVGFIRGCVMNVLFGETNEASVQLLNEAGCDVVTPVQQGCCGALYAHGGNLEKARACARRNIEAFEAHHLDSIVINAAGCGSTLKEYGHLLRDDPAWASRARAFGAKVKDLTEVIFPSKVQSPTPKVVTYHDACHLCHAQRITKQPRELIKAVVGKNFVELPESEVCCGSAGSYNLTEPEMAERLQRRKTENILKAGAQMVVTTNPGCILQIRAGLKKAGAEHIQVLHIADFLKQSR
ncbi:MAG TPA: heterodisulfide reductase-related iron-sulfur binding cluster, partial [Methylomirabilota bacterium]|nr:heterodisulfide reductase-related iron-sulfur binding cluster [Methylomirabilota bacterium]